MRQVYINPYEKGNSTDINSLQGAVHQSLFDDTLYNLFNQKSGAVNGAFAPTYVSALAASLAAGVGFFYDSTQTGYNPKYRMLKADNAVAVTFGAADGSHDRIDLVCLVPNFATTGSASRYIKSGGAGPITLQTVPKDKRDTYTLAVVAGTPAASPSVPATPSGYLAIAQAYIHQTTGMASQADLTSVVTALNIPLTGTQFTRYVSATGYGTDTTFAAALAALSGTGGTIVMMESLNLGTAALTINTANIELRGLPHVTLSGTVTGIVAAAAGFRIRGVRLSGFATGISISNGNNNGFVTECRFASCTAEVTDNNTTPNNVIANNISE